MNLCLKFTGGPTSTSSYKWSLFKDSNQVFAKTVTLPVSVSTVT